MVMLLKVHGSQNHFFILDQTELDMPLTDEELRDFTKKITNAQTGILNGADGVLAINKPVRKGALAQMRVINEDGSEASMCGNGLRTVARYLSEKYQHDHFLVDTMNASLRVHKENDFAKDVPAYSVEISPVRFNKEALPFTNLGHDRIIDNFVPELYPGLRFTSIGVPNPHLISFVNQQQISGPILGIVGKRLNSENPYFTDGVNVNFAQILDKNKLFVRTYERGVGFTNACGTGMSATSLALWLTHPEMVDTDSQIDVFNPGGMVKTKVHYDNNEYWIELTGNATFTHQITISENDLHRNNLENVQISETNEQQAYEHFVDSLPKYNDITTLA